MDRTESALVQKEQDELLAVFERPAQLQIDLCIGWAGAYTARARSVVALFLAAKNPSFLANIHPSAFSHSGARHHR